jgi:hypothetical protein
MSAVDGTRGPSAVLALRAPSRVIKTQAQKKRATSEAGAVRNSKKGPAVAKVAECLEARTIGSRERDENRKAEMRNHALPSDPVAIVHSAAAQDVTTRDLASRLKVGLPLHKQMVLKV